MACLLLLIGDLVFSELNISKASNYGDATTALTATIFEYELGSNDSTVYITGCGNVPHSNEAHSVNMQ